MSGPAPATTTQRRYSALASAESAPGTPSPPPDLRSRVALTVPEAAAALGLSADTFARHVAAELRLLRVGRSVPSRSASWCARPSGTLRWTRVLRLLQPGHVAISLQIGRFSTVSDGRGTVLAQGWSV